MSDLLSPPGRRPVRFALALALVLAVGATVAPAAVVSPATAASSRPCPPPKYPGLGYFTSLSVSGGQTCAGGGKVALAYYRCRLRGGGAAGRCHGRVDGYTCGERRMANAIEIDALVTCRKGRLTVVHSWLQMT